MSSISVPFPFLFFFQRFPSMIFLPRGNFQVFVKAASLFLCKVNAKIQNETLANVTPIQGLQCLESVLKRLIS